jgi:hypothetical protein
VRDEPPGGGSNLGTARRVAVPLIIEVRQTAAKTEIIREE